MLLGGYPDGNYNLYHQTGLDIENGFVLCEADIDLDNGGWYQLFYYQYSEEAADLPGCEFVGVSTTVAANIDNGACYIGVSE